MSMLIFQCRLALLLFLNILKCVSRFLFRPRLNRNRISSCCTRSLLEMENLSLMCRVGQSVPCSGHV